MRSLACISWRNIVRRCLFPRFWRGRKTGEGASEINIVAKPLAKELRAIRTNLVESSYPSVEDSVDGGRGYGWVVLGRRLEMCDLVGETGEEIMKELAWVFSAFRTKIPAQDRIGNVRLKSSPIIPDQNDNDMTVSPFDQRLDIRGLLYCHSTPNTPLNSAYEYYQVRLKDQLAKLETEDVFASKRAEVSTLVRNFMATSLQRLKLLNGEKVPHFVFTQYDFSPRNVLVSGSPAKFTGLVDFEFAGFFPAEEEFANTAFSNEDDWPVEAYDVFLRELERYGVSIPAEGIPKGQCNEAYNLMKLIENVAPWYLREGGIRGKKLEELSEGAANNVRGSIKELEGDMVFMGQKH